MLNIKCKNLIYLYGMQRCGTHAIANWLLQQTNIFNEEKVIHIFDNDIWYYNNQHVTNILFNCAQDKKIINMKTYNRLISKNNISDIETIVISYERCLIKKLANQRYSEITPTNTYHIISLRDLFNFMASLLKLCGYHQDLMHEWQSRAEEITGRTNYLNNNYYFINFNKWFESLEYRKNICKDLSLTFTDFGKNQVAIFGNGSSFDQRKFNGKASDMNVLNRYKTHKTILINRHKQAITMSREIFGELE